MKHFYSIALTIVTALAVNTSFAETVKIKVDGMVCGFCAASIEKKMRAEKATADVYVSLESKIVAVAEKPGQKLDDARLKAQILDAGYEVKAIERVSTSLAEVKASVKAKKS